MLLIIKPALQFAAINPIQMPVVVIGIYDLSKANHNTFIVAAHNPAIARVEVFPVFVVCWHQLAAVVVDVVKAGVDLATLCKDWGNN